MDNYIKINKDWWWFFNEWHEQNIPYYIEESVPRDIVSGEPIEEC